MKHTFQNHFSLYIISPQLLWSVILSSTKIWLFEIPAEETSWRNIFWDMKAIIFCEADSLLLSEVLHVTTRVTPRQIAETENCFWVENCPLTVPKFLTIFTKYFCAPRIVRLSNSTVRKAFRISSVYAIIEFSKCDKEIEFQIKVPFDNGCDWSRYFPGLHTSGKAAQQLHSKDA